ncbi:Tim44 domain-containing protein [Motiliproteus sp. SC1-56]|uniref:Tim44 domain-containing protein n=1 Tax=Motiliproteus sp. SC1-56 TaxID=2799565 RepID=UPI001A90C691|nr:Tim44-like domain-containing protein [Motiliproteus sp. SC1-56]
MTRILLTFCCALLLGTGLTTDVAEAKRFGGGSSFGKAFSTPKKVSPTPQPSATRSSSTDKAATTTRKPGMGGMLGGLLAGGLLGALFFGGAFEGIQLMDVLILGVLGFVLFKLFTRGAVAQRPPAYAGAADGPVATGHGFDPTPLMSSGVGVAEPALPEWFQKEAFLEGARSHFAELQTAWSENDLETIRGYCSAELFGHLEQERARLGAGVLDNDLVSVMAEILGYSEVEQTAQLSVNFYGWMREGAGAQTTEFNEIWHLTRDLSKEGADWFIVGIEQPS